MATLNVNIDHTATIRQARGTKEPDPVLAAYLAELAGAGGIVAHLREDRRHVQDRDLIVLRETVKTMLNIEMAATPEMIRIASDVKPDLVTLVPEKREELTTEGGLDVHGNFNHIFETVKELQNNGIIVSLFIDPDSEQINASKNTGAHMVEIHTGSYAEANTEADRKIELNKIIKATDTAVGLGLRVSAGHGLNYINVEPIATIKPIEELNIGHSIIARAVIVGVKQAVSEMIKLINKTSETK